MSTLTYEDIGLTKAPVMGTVIEKSHSSSSSSSDKDSSSSSYADTTRVLKTFDHVSCDICRKFAVDGEYAISPARCLTCCHFRAAHHLHPIFACTRFSDPLKCPTACHRHAQSALQNTLQSPVTPDQQKKAILPVPPVLKRPLPAPVADAAKPPPAKKPRVENLTLDEVEKELKELHPRYVELSNRARAMIKTREARNERLRLLCIPITDDDDENNKTKKKV